MYASWLGAISCFGGSGYLDLAHEVKYIVEIFKGD